MRFAVRILQSAPRHAPAGRDDGMAHPCPLHRLRQRRADFLPARVRRLRAADILRHHLLAGPAQRGGEGEEGDGGDEKK